VGLALVLAACGGGDGEGNSVAERTESGTLRIGEFSWSAAVLTNTILEGIVARHPELGIEQVERVKAGPERGWKRLGDGRLDVLTEVYVPNQLTFSRRARRETELVSRTYRDAINGWFVPRYAVEPGGPADGLVRVDQLNRYRDVLDRKLFDGEPGWVTTEQNADRIRGFGLRLEQVKGSETKLLRELERRFRAREPMLLYLWRPHWVHAAYELEALDEPIPYRPGCFRGSRGACAMPTNDVWVAARKDLAGRAPRVWELLRRFRLPIGDLEAMLAEVDRRELPADEVAGRWLDEHTELVASWIPPASGS